MGTNPPTFPSSVNPKSDKLSVLRFPCAKPPASHAASPTMARPSQPAAGRGAREGPGQGREDASERLVQLLSASKERRSAAGN